MLHIKLQMSLLLHINGKYMLWISTHAVFEKQRVLVEGY